MRKERKNLPLASILPNLGQLDWLPKNPRQWTKGDIDRTAVSIREDPDFLEDRPLLVVPFGDETFIVFAGNLRREGGIAAPLASAPSVVYFPETAEDFETIKRRAMKDNGSFGSWDFDELANSWDDLPLVDWGVPAWEGEAKKDEPEPDMNIEWFRLAEDYTMHLDFSYCKTCDWMLHIWKKGCGANGEDLIIFNEQDTDPNLLLAEGENALKKWLLDNNINAALTPR